MNDIHLYVDAFPNRVITLETEKALKKMLSLFQGSSLRITWLYRNQRLSFITILRLVLAERRLCKGRSITINNTIRFEAVKKISPAAICLLSDFNFSVIIVVNEVLENAAIHDGNDFTVVLIGVRAWHFLSRRVVRLRCD